MLLYEALRLIAPSPVVDLNHAVAVSMASGPGAAIDLVEALAADGSLAEYHPFYAVRGELFARLGRRAEARGDFLRAAELCRNSAERAVLAAKAADAGSR